MVAPTNFRTLAPNSQYIYTAPIYRLLYDDPCIGPYK